MTIMENILTFNKFVEQNENFCDRPIYMTSGGFDPLHVGHLRCIQETVRLANDPVKNPSNNRGLVVVVVNADSFLIRKKGYAFMPLKERMEIIDGIAGVDYVIPWEANGSDQTVKEVIRVIKPQYFTKGGDRFDPETIPEWETCQDVGCKIIVGVGSGGKIQSSSDLVRRAYGKLS